LGASFLTAAKLYVDAGVPGLAGALSLSPSATSVVGVVLLVIGSAGMAAILAGLAGLANPHSDRFLRARYSSQADAHEADSAPSEMIALS
jgi:hypothetical protein